MSIIVFDWPPSWSFDANETREPYKMPVSRGSEGYGYFFRVDAIADFHLSCD